MPENNHEAPTDYHDRIGVEMSGTALAKLDLIRFAVRGKRAAAGKRLKACSRAEVLTHLIMFCDAAGVADKLGGGE